MLLKKNNLSNFEEHGVKHIHLLWDLLAVSLCLVWAGNTAEGKRLKQKRQLCFLDSWSLTSPKSIVRVLFKKKKIFF